MIIVGKERAYSAEYALLVNNMLTQLSRIIRRRCADESGP
jgi:hypothetical protein